MEGSTALTALGQVITAIMGYMTEMITTISTQPLLLISVGIFLVGAAIGLAKRLIGA